MNEAPALGLKPPVVKGNALEMLREPARVRFARVMAFTRKEPVVRVELGGPLVMYLVSDPEGAEYVLQKNHLNYTKPSADMSELRHFLGNGLFTSEGDFWRRQRRLAQPAFHKQQLAALITLMVQTTRRMLTRWETYQEQGKPFDLAHEMMRLTLATVGETLFHVDLDQGASEVGAALTEVLKVTSRRLLTPLRVPMAWPTPQNLRFKRARKVLDAHVGKIISERRQARERPQDLLSMFLDVRDAESGEGMTDQQIRDEVMTLVLAGHETTANALSWAFYLLSTHPSEEARLRAEVDLVLSGRDPTFEDLPRLSYALNVIQESLRLYPPVWMIGRQSKTADVICGYAIPAGGRVTVSPYVLHHHPKYWEHPEAFDPERFTPERSKGRPRSAYIPFGGGPRLCIGNNFALMEAQIMLSMITQRYRLVLDPTAVVEPEVALTVRPAHGIAMTLHPPKPSSFATPASLPASSPA